MSGKGDTPRNVGKLFKKNYGSIKWGESSKPKPKIKPKKEGFQIIMRSRDPWKD